MTVHAAGAPLLDGFPSSMSKLTEVAEEDASELVAELQSRVRELEAEQKLMQRELDSVTHEAQRTDSHLRSVSIGRPCTL